MSAEEELEAAIWEAMATHGVALAGAAGALFVDDLVLIAQRYAAGDSEIVTALRRKTLHEEARP